MKQIQQYIKESILDDEDDIIQNNDFIAEQWLKDNYFIESEYTIKNKIINVSFGIVLVSNENLTQLLPDGYSFGVVDGSFSCAYCDKLQSLKGSPRTLSGDFNCKGCGKLKSLKGCPENVGGEFNCSLCQKLTSLDYCPKKVGSFICNDCDSLKNLKGSPKQVNQGYCCVRCKNLISLEGMPEFIGSAFNCKYCPKLSDFGNSKKNVECFIGNLKDPYNDKYTVEQIKKIFNAKQVYME